MKRASLLVVLCLGAAVWANAAQFAEAVPPAPPLPPLPAALPEVPELPPLPDPPIFVESAAGDCNDHYNVQFGDEQRTYRGQEEQTLPATVNSITVHGVKNGGILVKGWDRNETHVLMCKYAAADDDATGQARLSAIKLQISGGDITATGPEGERWSVHFFIQTPKNLAMKLETYNGPMKIENTAGDVEAHTTNGPLSLRTVSGTVRATAQNGPIEVVDSAGNINVSAQNGPLRVKLNDNRWNGQGLEASTHNGPLDVRVPENYQSGVDVEATGAGPFSCDLQDCDNVKASKPWDRDKRVHIGGQTAVHVSTVNGPVRISNTRPLTNHELRITN
jgi:hypothetical protein